MNLLNTIKKDEFETDFYERIDFKDYVVFIENENQIEIVNYIKNNYSKIKESFKLKNKKFILLSDIDIDSNTTKILSYLFPILNKHFTTETFTFNTLKKYLEYTGTIQTGILSIDNTSNFYQFENTSLETFKEFIREFLDSIIPVNYDEWDDLPFCYIDDKDENIKLDAETSETVNNILEQLQILKEKGSLLHALPIVENYLENVNTASLSELSCLKINDKLSILLPDYDLEIKLSHLTKSVYLLFLYHPEGILLSDLYLYKNELLDFYKEVSNREDFDKMIASIDDIINTKTNAIYVHLSRIKSTFTKLLHPSIAEYYIIDGGKNQPKKIKLDKKSLLWNRSFVNDVNAKIALKDDTIEFDEEAFWDE